MSLTLTWLGHSTVVLDLAGTRLIADPLLLRHNGVLRRRGAVPLRAAWSGAEAVLLSHLHHDHAETGSLRLLGDVPIITAPANAGWLVRRGLHGAGLDGARWMPVGDAGVEVRLVPADHHARPMPHRPNAANGHLVRAPGIRIWIGGDTALYDAMTDLPDLAGGPIDVAVVPVGGWGPRLSAGHMGPDQAAEACRRAGARAAIPVHWGTLHVPGGEHRPRGWMDRAGAAFPDALERLAPDCAALVLPVGGAVEVSGQ